MAGMQHFSRAGRGAHKLSPVLLAESGPAARHNALNMFSNYHPDTWYFWLLVTRLGEAQVVVPLALLMGLSHARSPEARAGALRWVALLGVAVLITTASKVAFIGWGIGSAALNFTGISGHAMFAAAVYPPLVCAITSGKSPRAQLLGIAVGCAVALLVGVSRYVLWTHSASEVLAGWLVGGLVSCAVLGRVPPVPQHLRATILVTAALWLTLMPTRGPAVDTHSIVVRVALKLSGHERPYTRSALLHARS
jgi:membrane-associated phospholipid phosphatase